MAPQIVDLTKCLVIQKVEELIKHVDISYRSAFSTPYLRQKLIVRVLNGSPSHYALSSDLESSPSESKATGSLAMEVQHIEQLIYDSLVAILQEEEARQPCSPTGLTAFQEPSHWFG